MNKEILEKLGRIRKEYHTELKSAFNNKDAYDLVGCAIEEPRLIPIIGDYLHQMRESWPEYSAVLEAQLERLRNEGGLISRAYARILLRNSMESEPQKR